MSLTGLLSQIFTWWNGNTPWTRYFTWRHGKQIGTDQFGNHYFAEKNGPRRWVIYDGEAEASAVPPLWHAWLHHTIDEPPTKSPLTRRDWETDHKPNMTGTPYATKPKGSLSTGMARQKATGDYEAWTPDA